MQAHTIGEAAPLNPFQRGEAPYFETMARRAARYRLHELLDGHARQVVIAADAGAGKTQLLERACRELGQSWRHLHLLGRNARRVPDVLDALLEVLGERSEDISVAVQMSRLGVRLAALSGASHHLLLTIDDAHQLPEEVLGVLLALAARPERAPGLSVVLVGRPVLLARLQAVAASWDSKHVIEILDLPALTRDEVADYVYQRAHESGSRGDSPFGDEVIDWIARTSHGHPGWIDSLAAHVLHRNERAARDARRRRRRRRSLAWWLAGGIAASAVSVTLASSPSRESAMDAVWGSLTADQPQPIDTFRSNVVAIDQPRGG